MGIVIVAFYLHLKSFAFDGTIHGFEHSYDFPAFDSAANRTLSQPHAFQKVPALILQGLHRFDPGADNVTVPDLEPKLAVVQWFLLNGTDALLEHSHLLKPVKVVEDNPPVTLDDYDLARLIGIGPTHVHVGENVVRVTERDESHVITAVAQDLAADSADPFRRAVQEEVEDGDVVRSKVPKRIHVTANGAKIRSSGVQIVDPAVTLLNVLFNLAYARIEDKCVTNHQYRGL
jgi:hypothetical protein